MVGVWVSSGMYCDTCTHVYDTNNQQSVSGFPHGGLVWITLDTVSIYIYTLVRNVNNNEKKKLTKKLKHLRKSSFS